MTVSETSLVGRLRAEASALGFESHDPTYDLRQEAAETIERLTRERDEFRTEVVDQHWRLFEMTERALAAGAQRDGAYEECARIAEAFVLEQTTDSILRSGLMSPRIANVEREIASAIRAARLKPDQ